MNEEIMALNKNKILGFSALLILLVGLVIIYLGYFRFKEWKYILGLVGLGFCILAWAFNALRGRL